MMSEGELDEDGSGIRLAREWLDKSSSGGIHSNIEDVPGLEIVDEQTGQRIVGGIRFQQGKGLKAGGLLLEARRWKDRKLEVRRVKEQDQAHGDWGYTSRAWLTGADQPQSVRRYLGIEEDNWPMVRISGREYVFHFGGAKMKALLGLMASVAPQNAGAFPANEWYVLLPSEGIRKPAWLEAPDSWALDMAISDKLSSLEHVLGRPHANRHLPLEARLREVRSWLKLDEEIRNVSRSVWTVPEDEETAQVLRELTQAIAKG